MAAGRALREALTNAVLHSDYSSPQPVQINVYSDSITIYNSGSLPVGWTVDDLVGQHHSWLCNPDLATVFFRSGQIEAWGRGIQRIQEACAAEDSPGPEYRTIGETLETTFQYNPVWLDADPHGAVPYSDDPVSGIDSVISATTKVGTKVGTSDDESIRINSTQWAIVSAMAADSRITAARLAVAVGITKRRVEYNIAHLRKLGLVSREGATKSGRWVVSQEVHNG